MKSPEQVAAIQSRRRSEREQLQLLNNVDGWHETIKSKLFGLYDCAQFRNFERCGHEKIFRTCTSCGDWKSFTYHCMVKWCPRCNWRITRTRHKLIERWSQRIAQPKHVVTTQRNTRTLNGRMIREHQVALAKLRRTNVFDQVAGGCVSVELTNESAGWHLHAHWLLDARWIDAQELSRTWGRLVGQTYAIVKVCDLRSRKEFAREVSKYVIKGSEMSKWDAEEIHQFVRAVKGRRFFFAFGSLFKEGSAVRAELLAEKVPTLCECGCGKFVVRSEVDQALHDIRKQQRSR